MSWFKEKYGAPVTEEAPDIDVMNVLNAYMQAHNEPLGFVPGMAEMKMADALAEEVKKPAMELTQPLVDAVPEEGTEIPLKMPPSAMDIGMAIGGKVSPRDTARTIRDIAVDPRTYLGTAHKALGGAASKLAGIGGKAIVDTMAGKGAKVTEQAATKIESTLPKYAENINLETMPVDVRQRLYDIVSSSPEIGITPKITNAQLIEKAKNLKDTPIINYLTNLSEGSLEAEAVKLRMGNTDLLRNALKTDLTDLKGSLDAIMATDIAKQRKVASIFGRGLHQQTISPETQQELAFALDDKIKMIKRDPAFGHDKELIGTLEKLRDTVIAPDFNPTAFNKVYSIWMNSILSSPMTHIVNTTSNTLFALSKIPEKFASATMDLPISLFTGKRTHFFGEIPAMLKGMVSKGALPEELAQAGSKIENYAQPIKGLAGKIINTPGKLLQLEDNLAKNVVGKMELYAQRYAGKTGDELIEAVRSEQLYRTFQNEPTALAKGLMQLRARVPFVRYVVPFIKTPANIIERGLERTPLVLGKIAYKAAKGTYNQAELAKDMGLLSMSSMLSGYIAWQVGKGNICGNAPEEKGERDAFFRQGKKPNSIKVGDVWIPLDRLEPFGSAFATITNLITSYQKSNKDIPAEKAMDAVASLGKTLSNKTYLSGMTGLLKGMSDPEMYGAGFFRRLASGGVPNVLSFFANLKDPYYREADSVLDYMKMKIPFASETLEPKLNAFGEPIRRDALNIGQANDSQLEQGIRETPVGFPSRKIGDTKLTTKEYNDLLRDTGGQVRVYLEKLTAHPQWMSLAPEAREKIIENIVSKVRKEAKTRIQEQHMAKFKEWASKIKPQSPVAMKFKSQLAKKYNKGGSK